MELPIKDRTTAGEHLAKAFGRYRDDGDVLVLALPRGGVPVAAPVARHLKAPLDLMVVRKLGFPGHEEFAMGAIASGGVRIMNDDALRRIPVSDDQIERVADKEQAELERRETTYRGDRPLPEIEGRTVVLVDDGIATGATMRAAMQACRKQGAKRVVVGVPVGPKETIDRFSREADEVICLSTPENFSSIGQWYQSFGQTSDDEVRSLLNDAWENEDSG
ncbi:putative phosphoribosyl transferase [Marinobacter daqiaonensis]|uniref:Putative phosphoribosyl transferase n=1 Tax=Marinobacter daqiaonensis TaxID=650891 RepID=A0A1I6J6L0_9GAMM|nr:phosphoribosyltransferase [Marinobacter daqiaonensis]SFR74547.1 putative phosphoribosyl transferase [Marinobacter daqiaonensis]